MQLSVIFSKPIEKYRNSQGHKRGYYLQIKLQTPKNIMKKTDWIHINHTHCLENEFLRLFKAWINAFNQCDPHP